MEHEYTNTKLCPTPCETGTVINHDFKTGDDRCLFSSGAFDGLDKKVG